MSPTNFFVSHLNSFNKFSNEPAHRIYESRNSTVKLFDNLIEN